MKVSKTVAQWIKYARTDLLAAKHNLEYSAKLKTIAAFHAQQCAEKIIKGYLTHHKVRVQKTHDIEQLLNDLAKVNPDLAKKLSASKVLTAYAVTYRYPDAERKPLTLAKAKAAIRLSEKVLEACLRELCE